MFDLSNLPLTAAQSRAARVYLGLSQQKLADLSGLQIHHLKRFEAPGQPGSVFVPDETFLKALRSFYEERGYQFNDTPEPGATAKGAGLVFPAGVVGGQANAASPNAARRPAQAQFHHMRIAIADTDEMGRVLDLIDANEDLAEELLKQPVEAGIFGGLTERCQARHAEVLAILAENGALFARLFGRSLGGEPSPESLHDAAEPSSHADLLHRRMADAHRVIAGDRAAAARRKAARPATSLTAALFGL